MSKTIATFHFKDSTMTDEIRTTLHWLSGQADQTTMEPQIQPVVKSEEDMTDYEKTFHRLNDKVRTAMMKGELFTISTSFGYGWDRLEKEVMPQLASKWRAKGHRCTSSTKFEVTDWVIHPNI